VLSHMSAPRAGSRVDVLDRLRLRQDQQVRVPSESRWNPQNARRETRPRHTAGPGSWCPMAPSEHQDALAAAASRAVPLGEIETLIGSAAFCAPLGRMPSKMADRKHEVRAVYGVEVKVSTPCFAVFSPGRRDSCRHQLARSGVVVPRPSNLSASQAGTVVPLRVTSFAAA